MGKLIVMISCHDCIHSLVLRVVSFGVEERLFRVGWADRVPGSTSTMIDTIAPQNAATTKPLPTTDVLATQP
eukprot:5849569-Amphidinium_carterae.1